MKMTVLKRKGNSPTVVRPLGGVEAIHRKQFDDLARLAARLCHTPMASITMEANGQQCLKAQIGFPDHAATSVLPFHRLVAQRNDLVVVTDADTDARLIAHRSPDWPPHVRFLTGVPLVDEHGHAVGSLAVMDELRPRLSEEQVDGLWALARQVSAQLELRQSLSRLTRFSTKVLQAESVLAGERNLLRLLIDTIPDNIYFKDCEGRYVLDNEAHMRFLGAELPGEVLGRTVYDFFPETLARTYDADDRAVIAGGQPLLSAEEPTVDRAGAHRTLLTSKIPMKDDAGVVTGLLCISRDITEMKQKTQALAESNRKLEETLEELHHTQQQLIRDERLIAVGQ